MERRSRAKISGRVYQAAGRPPLSSLTGWGGSSLAEMAHERGDPRFATGDVLLAIAAGSGDAADHLAIHHHGKTADKDGEASLMLGEDAEGLLARERVLVVMRRLAVTRGGEGLVHGDLHARHLAAVEAAEGDRVTGAVGDAQHFGHA